MGHPSRTSLTAFAAAVVALGLAGCGSDDPETVATSTSTAATAAAPAAPAAPATDAPATSASNGEAGTTVALGDLGYGGYPAGGAAATTTAAPAATGARVEIADSDLGRILVSEGATLYVFTPDEDAPAPTCEGGCADAWPPLLTSGDVVAGDGLEQARFATVTRGDGGEQVTFDGWPLYRYATDVAPGDVTGQGVGDKWYVIAPDGTVVD